MGTSESSGPVIVIDNFVSRIECERMLAEAGRGAWLRSRVESAGRRSPAGRERTSDSLFLPSFSPPVVRWLRVLEERLGDAVGIHVERLEPWQVTRYGRGTRYDYHLDCGAWRRHPSGERARTVMIVLQAPKRGGATHFRALGTTVRPVRGRLIVWSNLLPSGRCNYAMIHAGRPVWQGIKVIMTTWERQRAYVDEQGTS